ncbi:unnamed protein product [Peronospora farinosa]|uniref:Protein kinase domain-containing protein n=1 Tax=Peronospora farinosa TaxID=134698 RepID=A0AAV0T7X7_9STRA|nr:unnamed protein product [Peronospora farinosa]
MVSLRGHSISSRVLTRKNVKTGTTSLMPSLVTATKKTSSNKGAVTTVTTTTTTVTALNASNSTTSNTTGLANSATDESAGKVTTTTITTTQSENGSSPVTTITPDNGVNSTSTTTTLSGATTVTSKTDSETNRSVSNSTLSQLTNAGGSSAAPSHRTSTAPLVSTSTSSTPSSAEETNEGTSASSTNTGSIATTSSISTRGTETNRKTSAGTGSTSSYASNVDLATPGTSTTTSTTASTTTSNGSNGSATIIDNTKASSTVTESLATSTATLSDTSPATPSSSGYMTTSSSRSSNLSSSDSLKEWFTSRIRAHETQLVVSANSSAMTTGASYRVCNGLPALITRSNIESPNGGCPDELTALNASCTCLTGYNATASSWAFHVTTESQNFSTSATRRSLTKSSSNELAINTIRPIWVPSSLKTLEIVSTDDSPAEITFIDENREASNFSLTLVRSVNNSTQISTLSLIKLDLNAVAATKSDFVPVTVTNLTLRNCNISTLGSSFTRTWGGLQYLDLSSNNLDTEFVGGANLKELNLSHNALSVFPFESLSSSGLEVLYIQGNDINDFNVSQDQFEQIQALTAFKVDTPSSLLTCQGGAWQSAHGTAFCVLSASTAAAPDPPQSSGSTGDGDNNGLGLLAYWIIAGAITVFFVLLLVTWQRRRYSRESDISSIVSPETIEPVTPQYNVNHTFGDALNHDNVIAAVGTARTVVAAQAYPGYGRSHGNSVDSDDSTAMSVTLATDKVLASCRLDYGELILGRCVSRGGFGLVFVGSYRGRQVAVKKIRNERDVGREQVEQFVREISLISGLSHPRIVEFIGACWTIPAELSAVTELMERGDLRDVTRRFKRRGYRLSWESHKADIALHIAEALTYLHGLTPTVIHRDLKAKNVMLNADMEAKLSDFGIARERSAYDGSEHMTVGIGTSFWIAPEVLLGHDYDERADIYSFGVVLSEIDTDDYPYWNAQHPPQGKAQENEILRLVARGTKRPAFSDDCPPAILELAACCLRTDPEERPSAFEIVLYLQQLAQDRHSSASFSSMVRAETAFSGINTSAPAVTAPADTIVNLRSTVQTIQKTQEMASSLAAVAHAPGKRSSTTTKNVSSNVTTISRITAVKALAPGREVEVSSRQVTQPVACTKLSAHRKKPRRNGPGNTSSISEHATITGSIENARLNQSYVGARPLSPGSQEAELVTTSTAELFEWKRGRSRLD